MRGFWKNFRFRDIYVRFKEVSQNLNILAFVRLFNEFLFGLNRRQKISPFLKAIHRVFLLFEATLRRTQLSIPACAQLCEISLFRKFFKLLYVSDQPFFFFATVNFSSPPPNLVTKITSIIFSLVFPKISPPQFKNTPNENSNIINYPTLYVSLERKDFWPNFLLSKGSKSIPIAIYEIDAISIEFLLIGATDPITIPLRFFFKPVQTNQVQTSTLNPIQEESSRNRIPPLHADSACNTIPSPPPNYSQYFGARYNTP